MKLISETYLGEYDIYEDLERERLSLLKPKEVKPNAGSVNPQERRSDTVEDKEAPRWQVRPSRRGSSGGPKRRTHYRRGSARKTKKLGPVRSQEKQTTIEKEDKKNEKDIDTTYKASF